MQTIPKVYQFEKINNFRELGGYPSANGKTVRYGKLFRSGHLAGATGQDWEKIQELGIKTIIDLRTKAEANTQPSQLPEGSGIQMYHFPINDEFNSKSREDYLLEIKRLAVEGSVEHMMLDVYRGFVTTYTHQFRNFLHTVLEYNEDPVLWHCTAGKDRTGFASALLLKLFTVPQEIIENDYAISENHLQYQGIKKFFLRLMYGKKVAETVQDHDGNQPEMAGRAI